MDASFFSKPLSQLECRDNKNSCHLLEKKGTHPMRMHDNNTTCKRSNQNAGFLDTTNTTCNRSNQNARLLDTHSHSTNQHPAAPDTTKTTCYQSAAQCWKAFLVRSGLCEKHQGDFPEINTQETHGDIIYLSRWWCANIHNKVHGKDEH